LNPSSQRFVYFSRWYTLLGFTGLAFLATSACTAALQSLSAQEAPASAQASHDIGMPMQASNASQLGAAVAPLEAAQIRLENLASNPPMVFYVPGEHDVFIDGGQEFLNRFGQGTVGGGWRSFAYQGVHQVLQKVEGNITFHTAMSTAYPQPAPGTAAAPGPLVVPADQLRQVIGVRAVTYVQGQHPLALVDSPLG
jgi:hypothetical protein